MNWRRTGRLAAVLTTTVLISVGTVAGRSGGEPASASPTSSGVSIVSAEFVDSSRGTPARVGVAAHASRTIHELVYIPSSRAGPLPTVIFAPGWDNQSSSYDQLLRAMASAGYLVVGVDSPGSSSYFPGRPVDDTAGADIANDTIDLSAALENVEAGPLGIRVDRYEVAAVGHSDGGSVVANLALNRYFVSNRFNAYVVLSGDVPFDVAPGSFGSYNNGPVLAMVGTNDEFGNYTPQPGGGGTESVYSAAGVTKIMVTIAGATHLSAYIGAGTQADDTRAAITDFLDVAEHRDFGSRASFDAEIASYGLSAQQDLSPGSSFEPSVVGVSITPDAKGYWIAWSDGTVHNFGDAPSLGGASQNSSPIVAITGTSSGRGYWLVNKSGSVYPFGDAVNHGGMGGDHLASPIVAMAEDPATGGYWLLGGDGGVFSFSAPFFGSTGNIHLDRPAVGMTATASGHGYWLVASDGGVFTFGDASFRGSMGGHHLNKPVVGMASDRRTGGYWLDASDGGIFSFDAPFEGSTGSVRLNQPCVSMAADPSAPGYWLVAADGGIFTFGHAGFYGSDA